MEIKVNGDAHEITSNHLSEVLDELGFGSDKIATAVNGAFIPATLRVTCRLNEGDRLEILAPMQGG